VGCEENQFRQVSVLLLAFPFLIVGAGSIRAGHQYDGEHFLCTMHPAKFNVCELRVLLGRLSGWHEFLKRDFEEGRQTTILLCA
jgi:hypothetical protein